MNMAANPDKMAVTENQPSVPVNSSDSREDSETNKNQGKSLGDVNLKKKGTFKITSITKSYHGPDMSNDTEQEVEHDSLDDLDETVESHTEDASSEILDISKHTDGGEQASPMEEETSDNAITQSTSHRTDFSSGLLSVSKVEQNGNYVSTIGKTEQNTIVKEKSEQQGPHPTRFKVVKIETREPFKRGRWQCHDTSDFPAPEKSDSKINIPDPSSGIFDDPSKNPAKLANVIPGESHIFDNSMIRQPPFVTQLQTHSSNIISNIAQTSQNYYVPSTIHNGTGLSQNFGIGNSYAPGMSSMQVGDTTFVHAGQIPSTIQQGTGFVDKSIPYSVEQKDNVIQNVQDNKEVESNQTRAIQMGANILQDSENADIQQGAILTPQSVAEVVGIIPSPQEEDRSLRKYTTATSPLTPGGRIPELVDAEDQDVQNGSSTVAIDNKIEQAMDLVKSHLMYAVREEVEVLKEQIKELMDKNQQLEYENQILKNSASPETLAKLSNMPPSSST